MADPITLFVRAQDPSCDAAKKYLDDKNVEYTLRDVTTNLTTSAAAADLYGFINSQIQP